ncbi:DMT family transporter [Pectinatus haikarae]|uniref:DMT family transporter n=1 Tax=Pectinatus haikarae TaxID=349096 RepID=UPI001E2E580D|nr:DMT family transporter [Pectinatus haikarae]
MMNAKFKAYTAALIYTLIIGLSFMFVKIALRTAAPVDILADRFSIAFLTGSLIFLFSRKKIHIGVKDFFSILPLSLLYPVLFFFFQAFGLAYSTSAEAGIIQACVPILTLLLAIIFLKEYSSMRENLFTLLSVSGVIYIFIMSGNREQNGNTLGIILIFLSTLAAAAYNVLAKNLIKKYSATVLTYFMTAFGMVIFNCAALIQHTLNNTPVSYFSPFRDKYFFFAILYLGILSSFTSAFLSNYALGKIDASKMSLFANLGTLITIAAGVVFLQEPFHYYQVIGSFPILIGVAGANYFASKKK